MDDVLRSDQDLAGVTGPWPRPDYVLVGHCRGFFVLVRHVARGTCYHV